MSATTTKTDETKMPVYVTSAAARWLHEAGGDRTVIKRFESGERKLLWLEFSDLAGLASSAQNVIENVDSDELEWTGPQRNGAKRSMRRLIDSCVQAAIDSDRIGRPRRMRAQVVGLTFVQGYPANVHAISDGDIGELRPDPDNEHDPLAIGVWAWTLDGAKRIGHLKRRRDDIRRRLHDLFESEDLLGTLSVRIDPEHRNRPGVDIVFDLPAERDPLAALIESTEQPAATAAA